MQRKNFLYAGLLLMGIMGALGSGVVRAAETTITHYPDAGISYTLNNGTESFIAGTITITDGTDTITILDRNLGATKAGTGCDYITNGNQYCTDGDETYGYHFQWGNNWGFAPCTGSNSCNTFPNGEESTLNEKVDTSTYGPSEYSGNIFRKITSSPRDWSETKNDNLRGGKWDSGSIDTDDINSWGVTNATERQGPCPEGFHVPSYGELVKLQSMLQSDSKRNTGTLHNELLIPFAGGRHYDSASVYYLGIAAYLWSSSRNSASNVYSRHLLVHVNGNLNGNLSVYDRNRAYGYSLRCFHDFYQTYSQSLTLSFDSQGGSAVEEQTVAKYGTGIKPSDPTRDGYSFQYRYLTGHENTPFDFSTSITENTTLYAKWIKVVTVKFDVNGGNERIAPITGNYNEPITAPTEPTRASHRFLHRYLSGDNANNAFDFSTPITGDITLVAEWKKRSSSTGGGGGSSSSSETNTGSTTNTGDNNTNTGSTSTGTTNTGANLTGDTQDSSDKSSEGQSGFSQEFIDAYNFAFQNGITTMPTIDQADMTGNLTRIQMAKMLSYYAINIMGKKPDETRNNKFNDVSEKLDADYNNGVTLAYQLGIMGINMPNNNFRPNDLVTRGEFVTALSRMIYGTEDGEYENTNKYYTKHIEKLNEEEIIKQIDPSMKELRAYVMIMLKRTSKK